MTRVKLYSHCFLLQVAGNMKAVLVTLFLSSLLYAATGKSALRAFMPDNIPPMKKTGVDPGSPLFLTPYIEKKQFDLGKVRSLSISMLRLYAQIVQICRLIWALLFIC